ncbi:large ribosomal subunit protein bL19m [Planococcus citri]|uniref:large ribosomal subunit protein bL19m n=1 Tax=Planococcus citri TaxID=170843 RepID=UPI0031F80F99
MFGVIKTRPLVEVICKNHLLKYNKCFNSTSTAANQFVHPVKDQPKNADIDLNVRHIYPEFLPDPNLKMRNHIREKLERSDMLKRRAHIELPEFYVGSILAVTSSNVHAPMKTTRFLGICIQREGCGLRATFTLRNTVDNQGIEITYDLYDPKIQKVEVIRLEKRIDKDIRYLADAEPEYTTFPMDMEPEYLAEGETVPVNPIQVKLKPIPWRARYEIKDYKGIKDYDLPEYRWKLAGRVQKIPEEYVKNDLMQIYRNTIPEDEQKEIFTEVLSEIQKYEIKRRKIKRRSGFVPPKKSA